MKSIDDLWKISKERTKAIRDFFNFDFLVLCPSQFKDDDMYKGKRFDYSQEFANGRYEFRRRMNNSPWSETT